jgi:uncharacterized protein YaeQ
MALSATVFRCTLQIADMDRSYYQTHSLTLARHPSETDERMMVRVVAFALNATEHLGFSRGLSQDDEPDLWQHALSGEILLWIEMGQPDERRIRKACSRSKRVIVYCFQHRAATAWWKQAASNLQRFQHLSVFKLPDRISEQLATLTNRNMNLQCTIQDGDIWVADENTSVHFTLERWQ